MSVSITLRQRALLRHALVHSATFTKAPHRGTFTEQFGTCAPGYRTSFNTDEADERHGSRRQLLCNLTLSQIWLNSDAV